MALDDYEQRLAAWKARHGISGDSDQSAAEQRMMAEDAKDTGKAYCWHCGQEFPITDMRVDTNPHVQYEDRPHTSDGYIPSSFRVRACKPCYLAENEEESEPSNGFEETAKTIIK